MFDAPLRAIGQAVHRGWHGSDTRTRARWLWALWSGCVLLGMAGAAVAMLVGAQADADLAQALQRAASRPAPARAEPVAAAASVPDPVATLPRSTAPLEVVATLQRAAGAAGVGLSSVGIAEHAASVAQLGRVEFDVVMRGPYPAVKQVLAEVLGRYRQSTVRQLRWRTENASTLTELQVLLVVWSRPLPQGVPAAPGPGR